MITLRLSYDEYDGLLRVVEHANAQAEANDLPQEITLSSWVRSFILKASNDLPLMVEPTLQTKVRPNVLASSKKMREGR